MRKFFFNITVLEALASFLTLARFGTCKNRIFLHVGNLGALYALVKGVSKNKLLSAIACAFNKYVIDNDLSVYIAYIASQRNIADVTTRLERLNILSQQFGIEIQDFCTDSDFVQNVITKTVQQLQVLLNIEEDMGSTDPSAKRQKVG